MSAIMLLFFINFSSYSCCLFCLIFLYLVILTTFSAQFNSMVTFSVRFSWASLVAQWSRIHLSKQETHMCGANKPMHQLLSLCSRALEPQLPKSEGPGSCASQQEKPQQWETCTPQLESNSCSLQLEKSLCSSEDPAQPNK